jgi:hypothetical protein
MPDEIPLIGGKILLRPDDNGSFDELLLYDRKGGHCIVHAEMMDKGLLWIGIYPPGETKRRAVMWIGAEGNKLSVNAQED